jgi:transposase InsO family protein
VSERRACLAVEQHRSTQRYRAIERDDEKKLVAAMHELARQHPRYGHRRICALLQRAGWRVNKKRVQRLWRQEGLKVLGKPRKVRRLGSSENGCTRRKAERKNQVWSYDFVHDLTEGGLQLKFLTVVDEFTRESLAIEVAHSFKAKDVIVVLERLVKERGAPEFIRSDNGPEFIAQAVVAWLQQQGSDTAFIQPGAPWENAYIETFNGKFRDELLDREMFTCLAEAKHLAKQYRIEYNHERPHSSLGYRTPAEFASGHSPSGSATLRLRANARSSSQPVRLS